MIEDTDRHELIIPNDDISFKLFLFEGKDGNYVRAKHWHRSVEIFAVLEGELDFFLDEDRIHLRPGHFVLVNSNEIHSIQAPCPNQTVVLQIPAASFRRYYQAGTFIYFTHSVRDTDRKVMELIREMYEIYQNKQLGYELVVQSRFYELLYLLVLKYREPEMDRETIMQLQNRGRLSDIIEYIRNNYNKDLTLAYLGTVFGYSATYISKMFKKYAGGGFKKYLISVRAAHAAQDLLQTDDTMDVIASRHGFPDRKALNRAFREIYQVSPQQYRKGIAATPDVQVEQKS